MKRSSFWAGIFISIAGLLLLIVPRFCVQVLVILLGVEAFANGIYGLTYVRKLIPDSSFQNSVFCRSIMSIVVGLLAIVLPLRFAQAMWTIMLFVLAFYMILASLLEMFVLGKLRDTQIERRPFMIESVVSIVAAILMFVIGARNGETFIRIVGAVIFVLGGLFTFVSWKNRPIVAESVEVVDDISGTIEKSIE